MLWKCAEPIIARTVGTGLETKRKGIEQRRTDTKRIATETCRADKRKNSRERTCNRKVQLGDARALTSEVKEKSRDEQQWTSAEKQGRGVAWK